MSDWPTQVQSRDGKVTGRVTSTSRRCQLEGCGGIRIGVRWPDGRLTYPCSKGLIGVEGEAGTWRIR